MTFGHNLGAIHLTYYYKKMQNVGCRSLIKMWQKSYQFVSTNTPFISFVLPQISFVIHHYSYYIMPCCYHWQFYFCCCCCCRVISSLSISLLHKFISSLLATTWPFNFQVSLNMLTYNTLSRPWPNLNCSPTSPPFLLGLNAIV